MAEKQSNKERLKDITDSIEQGIKEMFNSDKYKQYLSTMSRFHKYSVNNQVLIYMQRPDATLVAGFNKWRDNFGRNVMKGEKGIKIIAPTPFKKKIEEQKLDPDTKLPMLDADGKVITEEKEIKIPMYKPVVVFDVSQTDGKPLPELASTLTGEVQNYDVLMEALKRSAPVPLAFEAMTADMDGYFSRDEQRIAIREGMSEVQTVCAAIHEIAHSKLHNTENIAEEKLSRATEEIQAESISFAVCAYYGIETDENSFGYLASWAADKDLKELRESLETINKTSSSLITDIDRNYAAIMKEREVEMTAEVDKTEMDGPVISFYTHDDKQIGTLYDVLRALRINDIELSYNDNGTLVATDSDNTWVGAEFYTFLMEEAFVYEDNGSVLGIKDELYADFKALAMENGVEVQPTAGDVIEAIARNVQEEPSVTVPDNGDVPDPAISVESMNAYGYTDSSMLPLTKERALELMENDVTVYMLHTDNTEAMAFDASEVMSHDGIFGIEVSEWEAVKDRFTAQTPDYEQVFQNNPADSFAIYQLTDSEAASNLRFMNMEYLERKGLAVDKDNYKAVYAADLIE